VRRSSPNVCTIAHAHDATSHVDHKAADRHTHHVDSDGLSDCFTHHVDSYALADRHTHHADSDADAHANTFAHTDRRTLANAVLRTDRDADDETAHHRRAVVLSFAHADGGALALAHNDAYECSVVAADGPADVVAHAEVRRSIGYDASSRHASRHLSV
jgi:hypothetical protein